MRDNRADWADRVMPHCCRYKAGTKRSSQEGLLELSITSRSGVSRFKSAKALLHLTLPSISLRAASTMDLVSTEPKAAAGRRAVKRK